jgi:hypothetical protein
MTCRGISHWHYICHTLACICDRGGLRVRHGGSWSSSGRCCSSSSGGCKKLMMHTQPSKPPFKRWASQPQHYRAAASHVTATKRHASSAHCVHPDAASTAVLRIGSCHSACAVLSGAGHASDGGSSAGSRSFAEAGSRSVAEAGLQGTGGTADRCRAGAEWQHAVVRGGHGAGHLLRRPPRR